MVAKIGVLIALLSLVPLKTLIAAEESPNLADAKKEGKVVLYVSAQLPLAQTISRAFEKKYPFLKVEITRTSGDAVCSAAERRHVRRSSFRFLVVTTTVALNRPLM